jgi:C-terminal processing protease CtpA/Prc
MVSKCKNPEVRYNPDKTRAVIYFLAKKRKCAPYFLSKENGAWKLDIASMSKLILFNQNMKWHFNLQWKDRLKPYIYGKLQWSRIIPKDIDTLLEPYKFAFIDLSFDKNGYPVNFWKRIRFGLQYNEYIIKGKYAGVFVNDLYSKGVALKSGFKVWDKIISWDGKKIQKGDMKYLEDSMKNAPVGKVMSVVVQRRTGKKSYKTVKIDMVAP